MGEQRSNGHTVSNLTVHLVWSTKYRYSVLNGDIKIRCRTLLKQIVELIGIQSKKKYSKKLRRVAVFNEELNQVIEIITNNLSGQQTRLANCTKVGGKLKSSLER